MAAMTRGIGLLWSQCRENRKSRLTNVCQASHRSVWETETDFIISSLFCCLTHSFSVVSFEASSWRTSHAEVTAEMNTACLAILHFSLAQLDFVLTKRACEYFFLMMQGNNYWILITEALKERGLRSSSKTRCRKTWGWRLKSLRKNRAMLVRGREGTTIGKSEDGLEMWCTT